jgi:BirA family biotin operon repressor/biotin-[acetyl-CoA-carboxylase] ligase
VASALDVAWDLVAEGRLPVFGSVLAASQTAGRGRHGRAWLSVPGHVYAALRLPAEPPFSGTLAPLAAALLLARAMESLDGSLSISIKWPNDLIALGGKIGGILVESRRGALLAGVGLNLGRPPLIPDRPPGAPRPAALPPAAGPPERLWPALAKILIKDYNDNFGPGPLNPPLSVTALAEARLLGLGRPAVVLGPASTPKADLGEIRGLIRGLDPSGALTLETLDGPLAIWSGTLLVDG